MPNAEVNQETTSARPCNKDVDSHNKEGYEVFDAAIGHATNSRMISLFKKKVKNYIYKFQKIMKRTSYILSMAYAINMQNLDLKYFIF